MHSMGPLLAQSGHALLQCMSPLLTQSGHQCLHREFGLIAIYMIDYGSSLRQDHLECSLRWGIVWDFGTLSLRLTRTTGCCAVPT